jgi:transketolase
MRTAFIQALCDLAEEDSRVMLLTADLGWSVLERFAKRFPDRFINVGVAEQNMLGIATGLARDGLVPFCYSIATFASMRCYEQIRNGPVMHELPVRIIGTGGGFSYGHAGPTHHALEDLTIGRTLPGLTVLAPVDGAQTRTILRESRSFGGPIYLRLEKTEYPDVPTLEGRFHFDQPIVVRTGNDMLFLTTGSITHEVLKAAEKLEHHGVHAAVAVQSHLSFEGGSALALLLRRYSRVFTVEEGSVTGGLGSLAGETIAEWGLACRLTRLGVRTPLLSHFGGRGHLLHKHGLDAAALVAHATSTQVAGGRAA